MSVNMAERVPGRKLRRPKSDGVLREFYPGEVVRILKLEAIDYRQVRGLFKLAVMGAGGERITKTTTKIAKTRPKWSRFSFVELLAARIALDLARPSNEGARLRLAQVERACLVLRAHYGVRRPLVDVRLRRVGAKIVAEFGSSILEPTSGQLLIPEVAAFTAQYVRTWGERPPVIPACRPETKKLADPVAVVVA